MPAVMRRKDRRVYRLDLLTRLVEPAERRGLEIGAVGPPTIDPSLGSCQYADFLTAEERARASGSPVETLAPVTIPLTRGQALSEQIPGRFEYVILHGLHRVPDPISCLDDLTEILEPEGVLLLVIPDKRGTHDAARPSTTIDTLLYRFHEAMKTPPLDQILESRRAWSAQWRELERESPREFYEKGCRQAESGAANVRCNVWAAHEFFDQLRYLIRGGFVDGLGLVDEGPTERNFDEFHTILRHGPTVARPANLEGKLIRSMNAEPGRKLYLVEGGMKRWIISPQERERIGTPIYSVSDATLAEIPTGPVLTKPAGHLRSDLSEEFLAGDGIEIGARHLPLWTSQRARVRYVDILDMEENQRRHAGAPTDVVDIDVLDDGETLEKIEDGSLDFIIANHFLEHTENPLGTIRVHLRKLRLGGVLFYAHPDKRNTFDIDRPLTSYEHLVRDDVEGPEWSRIDHYREFARLVAKQEGDQIEAHARTLMDMDNRIHFHVWDADSMAEILTKATEHLGNSFEVAHFEYDGREMITVLRKLAEPPTLPGPRERRAAGRSRGLVSRVTSSLRRS